MTEQERVLQHQQRIQPFIDAVMLHGESPLIYADWLEEHGDQEAEWIRLGCPNQNVYGPW